MKEEHINVNIVNMNTQISVILIHTSSPYMRVEHINVSIVSRNSHERVVSINTSSPYIKVKHNKVPSILKAHPPSHVKS